MSSQRDLRAHFKAMEALVEAQPEGANAEIAHGAYLMCPRPSPRHAAAQIRLGAVLHERLGRGEGSSAPDWLFLAEPEIRSETAFSRLIPDVAGWRRSTSGWPDPEVNPIPLPPEWAAEILSPGTEEFDRGPKKDAYGLMGVGWLWLLDVEKRTVETFANVRGKMTPGPLFAAGHTISAPPFLGLSSRVDELFLP